MKNIIFVLSIVFLFFCTKSVHPQFLEKLKKEVKKQIDNKKIEETKSVDTTKKDTNTIEGSKQDAEKEQQLIISSKYDFMPGEKIIFFDDFTTENIGDFPVQWNTTGSGEVVTTNLFEGRWFQITNGRGITTLDETVTLPENYTIEFDVIPMKNPKNNNAYNFSFYIISTSKPKDLMYGIALPGEAGIRFNFEYSNSYSTYYNDNSPKLGGSEPEPKLQPGKKYRISIWVQKERIRLYIGDVKLFDLPKAMSKKYKFNMIRFDNGTPMITNVRIATGLPDMRNKLLTDGKLISYGIYFDVNKDIIKPESYPSIKEIAGILNDNPTIRIKIVGHTDSDGDDKSNLDLSKRRASSVKNALVNNFSIDASRLETDGKGEGEPIVSNDSGVNKALNRRVEFIKL